MLMKIDSANIVTRPNGWMVKVVTAHKAPRLFILGHRFASKDAAAKAVIQINEAGKIDPDKWVELSVRDYLATGSLRTLAAIETAQAA